MYCNIFFVLFFKNILHKLFCFVSVFFFFGKNVECLLDPKKVVSINLIIHACSHSFTVSLSALYWSLGDIAMSKYTPLNQDQWLVSSAEVCRGLCFCDTVCPFYFWNDEREPLTLFFSFFFCISANFTLMESIEAC